MEMERLLLGPLLSMKDMERLALEGEPGPLSTSAPSMMSTSSSVAAGEHTGETRRRLWDSRSGLAEDDDEEDDPEPLPSAVAS